MARPGKHKYKYDKYKNSGHLAENKRKKEQRHKNRLARFAKRKEEGKCYEYKPISAEKETAGYERESRERSGKNTNKNPEFQRWKSIMAKLENAIQKEIKEMKSGKRNEEGKGKRQRPPRDEYDDVADV